MYLFLQTTIIFMIYIVQCFNLMRSHVDNVSNVVFKSKTEVQNRDLFSC